MTKDTLKVSLTAAKKSYCKSINSIDNKSIKLTTVARLFVLYLKGNCHFAIFKIFAL